MILWNLFLIICIIQGNFGCEYCEISSADYDSTVVIDSYTTINSSKLINHSHVHTYATIGSGNVINNTETNSYVVVEDGNHFFKTNIGKYSTISSNNVINQSVIVGYVTIDDKNNMDQTHIDEYTRISSNNQIYPGSKIGKYVIIENGVKIYKNSEIMKYSVIRSDAQIGEDCLLDSYAIIGSKANLEKKVYVGMYAYCGSSQHLREWVVLEKYASLDAVKNPEKYSVVIELPTSKYLYSMSVNIGIIDETKINAALKVRDSSTSHNQFNDMLHDMMKFQSDNWVNSCKDTELLPVIVSLYLIAHDGREKFNEEHQNFIRSGKFDGDHTDHFSVRMRNKILTDRTQDGFRKLIAIHQDKNREFRVKGDEFCYFVKQVLNGERKVVIDSTTRTQIIKSGALKNIPQLFTLLLLCIYPVYSLIK